MGINVPPGTFGEQYSAPALGAEGLSEALKGYFAGTTAGEVEGFKMQQEQKKQAMSQLASYIALHGPDAVNQPEWNAMYKAAFGHDWPSTTKQVPVPGTAAPAVPGATQGTPSEIGAAAAQPVPPTPPQTQPVTMPMPIGGDRTWGELFPNVSLPPDVAALTPWQTEHYGVKIEEFLKPQTEAQMIGAALQDWAAGRLQQDDPRMMLVRKALDQLPKQPANPQEAAMEQFREHGWEIADTDKALVSAWFYEHGADKANIANLNYRLMTEGEGFIRTFPLPVQPGLRDYRLHLIHGPTGNSQVDIREARRLMNEHRAKADAARQKMITLRTARIRQGIPLDQVMQLPEVLAASGEMVVEQHMAESFTKEYNDLLAGGAGVIPVDTATPTPGGGAAGGGAGGPIKPAPGSKGHIASTDVRTIAQKHKISYEDAKRMATDQGYVVDETTPFIYPHI